MNSSAALPLNDFSNLPPPLEGQRQALPPASNVSARLPKAADAQRAAKAQGAFLTISEVAALLEVEQHVLRFWETKFGMLQPLKRAGGRRYYRPQDVALLQRIRSLLYKDGYTIKGVQKLLQSERAARPSAGASEAVITPKTMAVSSPSAIAAGNDMLSLPRQTIHNLLDELKQLRGLVE